ncbi:hypothetical protein BDV96DRAFT_499971 [Lophiotrema nucula]|uniref:Uncharacterized protein n=1 Tax=Lophiotrema nucula TaxID=690887 RepID=A0A6A5YWH0_9PLEO|nr:hypothetical protein BDV96DRAFT_499971 [Lophiotrema nucula]
MSKSQEQLDRKPPFSKDSAIPSASASIYPATFRHENLLLDPQQNPHLYLSSSLLTPKLNIIYPCLWLAGLTRPARPLHRQRLMRRVIYLTESPNEHLVWHKDAIFVKPVPEWLLDYGTWELNLCGDEELHGNALGLLLSYVWLIASVTDYHIAIEAHILPSSVSWQEWQNMARDILHNIDSMMARVDRRYHYGELRLSRLNTLYRLNPSTFSFRNLVYGFMATPTWYTQFFERNFSWILAAFIYITVILSAMQVGLATSHLQENSLFQDVSYGVAVFSIVAVVSVVGVMLSVWMVLFWFHLCSTIRHRKRETVKRRKTLESKG